MLYFRHISTNETLSDFLIYHPDLPPSQLSTLENSLALPLGCEESSTAHMKASARRAYTFFLAETGLKAILKRVPKFEKEPFPTEMGNADNAVRPQTLPAAFILSPVNDELDGQLSIWLSGVPTFLSWSPEPCLGEQAKVGTRLKLLYWFARLSLYNASIKHILDLGGVCFSLQAWGLVQDMLFAAQNCVHIFAFEECDPDPILQYR